MDIAVPRRKSSNEFSARNIDEQYVPYEFLILVRRKSGEKIESLLLPRPLSRVMKNCYGAK